MAARDMRVRWALEEVGQPYEVRLVSFGAMKEPAHRALHPFGQIPTYEEGDLALFESGAIVFHIAERHAGLLPDDANEGPVQGVACSHWRLSHCRVVPQQLDDPPHERRN
jgi:glutathione S-transferase